MSDTKRILIVEDEIIVAESIRSRLEQNGYEVTAVVVSGEDAIEAVIRNKPDLALMDIKLKGDLDGIEAAGILYKELNVPVIFLTAHDDHSTLDRAKSSDPFGFLTKPFDERQLLITIEMGIHKSTMMNQRDEMVRDFIDALDRVKLLQGLLPICSHCKKIKDEDDQWESIESYIHKHSEVVFSHGICPECIEKYYPGIKINNDES